MAADHDPPMRPLAAFRRSSLGNLYQSIIRRRKSVSAKRMTDADGDEEDRAGPSSIELPSSAPGLRRTQSYSTALSRLGDLLRRSLNLSGKRERASRILLDGAVAVDEDLLREVREGTFTKYANINVISYDESYPNIQLVQQTLRRNRPDEIKKLLRKTNWPVEHEIRANLWQEICRHNNSDFSANKGGYEPEMRGWEQLDGRFSPKVRFLQTADTIHNNYTLNENGLAALHRLMRALDSAFPTLSYAALLRPMLALFLHYMSEEDAFACAFRLLKNRANYMDDSALARKASSYTLLALVRSHKGAVYKTLKNWMGTSEEDFLTKALYNWPKWIMCFLPFEYLIRIIDCYLYEGNKILYRVAVTLLHTWHKSVKKMEILTDKTYEERIELLAASIEESVKHEAISITALLEAATGIRNFRGAKIARLQRRFEKKILETEGDRLPTPDLPAMHTKPFISSIVSPDIAFQLMCHLPEKYQLKTPVLIYRLSDDGSSFHSFWNKIDEAESTLMIIRTDKGEILGAYCDEPWENRTKKRERERGIYFGGGLSFVWNLGENNEVNVYGWKENRPECFMAAPFDPNPNVLMIGGNAIYIREALISGSTLPSNTFGNPELVKGGAFQIDDIEVFQVCEWESKAEEDQRKEWEEKDKKREEMLAKFYRKQSDEDIGAGIGKYVTTPNMADM